MVVKWQSKSYRLTPLLTYHSFCWIIPLRDVNSLIHLALMKCLRIYIWYKANLQKSGISSIFLLINKSECLFVVAFMHISLPAQVSIGHQTTCFWWHLLVLCTSSGHYRHPGARWGSQNVICNLSWPATLAIRDRVNVKGNTWKSREVICEARHL